MTAARTIRMGFISGCVYGLVQDALQVARGERVGYVAWAQQLWSGGVAGKGDGGE